MSMPRRETYRANKSHVSNSRTPSGTRVRVASRGSRAGIIGISLAVLCVAAGLMSSVAHAIPAAPTPHALAQPDGSTITVFLRGDEYLSWHEDANGYLLVQPKEKAQPWKYGRLANKRLEATNHVAGSVDPEVVGVEKPDPRQLRAIGLERRRLAVLGVCRKARLLLLSPFQRLPLAGFRPLVS